MENSSRQLGWALIGCGSAGKMHTLGAIANPDIVVRGFCDLEIESAMAFSCDQEGSYFTADYFQILSDPTIDIVSIATSHDSHAELSIAALQAGKHVFLEKPMALNSVDCLRIEAARIEADRTLMLNHSIRFSNTARTVRNRLGPIKVSHGQCTQSPVDLSKWRWHPIQGGGPLYDVGVHALDLICWMHGDRPVEVYATGGSVCHADNLGSSAVVDTVVATLRFADGGASSFLMADAGRNQLTGNGFFQFFDGSMSAVIHDHWKAATFTHQDPSNGRQLSETIRPDPEEHFAHLINAIRSGIGPTVGTADGRRVVLLVERILDSIATGSPQRWVSPELE